MYHLEPKAEHLPHKTLPEQKCSYAEETLCPMEHSQLHQGSLRHSPRLTIQKQVQKSPQTRLQNPESSLEKPAKNSTAHRAAPAPKPNAGGSEAEG